MVGEEDLARKLLKQSEQIGWSSLEMLLEVRARITDCGHCFNLNALLSVL